MNSRRRTLGCRAGFSFMEIQVGFLLLGFAMVGLGPLVVMQTKHLKKINSRFDDASTYYLVPFDADWAPKLGAAAMVTTSDPGPPPSPPVTLIDNLDPGYSEVDAGSQDWMNGSSPKAYLKKYRRQNGGGSGATAYWTFAGVKAGWYEVLVTYPQKNNHATKAPYSIFDDWNTLSTVLVNQKSNPSGPLYNEKRWDSLGTFSIQSDTVRVSLDDNVNRNKDIAADAVRIVPVRNNLQILSVAKSLTSEEVTADVSVTIQTP